jgi:hypothetical protein
MRGVILGPRSTISNCLAAVAISIDEAGGIRTGKAPAGVATFWVVASAAIALCRRARRHAGRNPNADAATRALHQAARDLRIVMTASDVAIERASDAAGRLDQYLEIVTRHRCARGFH